jgi:hypothetical protein
MNCDLGACTPHCVGPTLSCSGGSTQCGSWNWDSNTGEGWQPVLTQIGTATNFQIKSAPGGSLAFSFKVNNTGTYGETVIKVPLCNGQMASARDRWVTAQVYAEGPALTVQSNMTNAVYLGWDGLGGGQAFLLYPANTWVTIGDSTNSNIGADGITLFTITVSVETGWVGTIYIDNFQLH